MEFSWQIVANPYLRDFDDTPTVEGEPSGLAATQVLSRTPAAASLLAGTSSNPLDDLVSIFGGGGGALSAGAPSGFAFGGASGFGSMMSPATPSMTSPMVGTGLGPGLAASRSAGPPPTPQQPQSQQEDLLGLF